MPLLPDTLTDQRTRAYLYRVLLTVGLLLAVPYGVITRQDLEYWALVAAQVLGTGTATYNTPRPRSKGKGLAPVEGQSFTAELVSMGIDGEAIHKALLDLKRKRGGGLGLD